MSQPATQTPVVVIKKSELPFSCPRPEDVLWNMHPRVYLPLEEEGRCTCPYCGAVYQLEP